MGGMVYGYVYVCSAMCAFMGVRVRASCDDDDADDSNDDNDDDND